MPSHRAADAFTDEWFAHIPTIARVAPGDGAAVLRYVLPSGASHVLVGTNNWNRRYSGKHRLRG